MKCIAFVGYMCAGKTTIGRSLARSLNCNFYDLDWYIEERFHKRIPQIFADEGEATFRDLEHRMLQEVAAFEDIVLSCGGGTPCFFDNMDYLNSVAQTVYLRATPEVLCSHIALSRGVRPLLQGKSPDEIREFVTQQLAERSPWYEKAQHIIDIRVLDTPETIKQLVARVRSTIGC